MKDTSTKQKKLGYEYAVGRRKTSTARVRFYANADKPKGSVTVNEKPLEQYFPAEKAHVVLDIIALVDIGVDGYFTVVVSGGGTQSQAEAIRHGIARLMVRMNEDSKPLIKSRGFLTRDPRVKERKKPGLRRARRSPQWSKR